MDISNSDFIGKAGSRLAIMRWSIFAVFAFSYIWVYFHRMAPAVVSTDLKIAFGITASELGSLAAMYYYISALTQIPSGVVADMLGTRISITIANLIAGIGSIWFGLATTFEEATFGRFLVGFGVSVVFVCFMKSNAAWSSPKQYGLISGLTLLIGNLGSVIAGSPLEWVIQYFSWRSVFVVIGVVSIGLSIAAAIVIRNSPDETHTRFFEFASDSDNSRRGGWQAQLGSVLKNPRIWPCFAVNFGLLGGFYSFSGLWAVPFLHDVHHLSRSTTAGFVTFSLLGLAIGSFCLGWLSDVIGRRKLILACSVFFYAGTLLWLIYFPFNASFIGETLFFFLGFFCGSFVLTYALAKDVASTSQAGMAVSVVNTGVFIGASFIQSAYGWLLDQSWNGALENGIRIYAPASYEIANFFMLAASILALTAALFVKHSPDRKD